MNSPVIFCEPFAGSAAVSYHLLGSKPPISYLGNKQGYSHIIAAILGLKRPAGIVLGEVGPWAAVHATLGGAMGDAGEVARWVQTGAWCYKQADHESGGPVLPGERRQDTRAVAVAVAVDRTGGPRAPEVAAIIRSWANEEPRKLWDRLKAEGWPSLLPVPGGRWLGPCDVGEVAKILMVTAWEKGCGTGGGWQGPDGRERPHSKSGTPTITLSSVADRQSNAPPFPPLAVWQGTAETLALPESLDGWVIFADPPYQNTSGYPHGDCPRASVLRLARDWSERGATVAISEAVPLADDLGPGWEAVEIGHERKGQKRTFGPTSEWLTLNRTPLYRPHRGQVGLW